jgi:hypothetical protein
MLLVQIGIRAAEGQFTEDAFYIPNLLLSMWISEESVHNCFRAGYDKSASTRF